MGQIMNNSLRYLSTTVSILHRISIGMRSGSNSERNIFARDSAEMMTRVEDPCQFLKFLNLSRTSSVYSAERFSTFLTLF